MHLYPAKTNPYYIVAPPYERTSAGIKALYLLCQHINIKGYNAYIVITDGEYAKSKYYNIPPNFIAPILNSGVVEYHKLNCQTPIIIYPEVIPGNPLGADCVVRYVMNFPGLLGGDASYNETEIIYAYSSKLAEHVSCNDILHIPTVDTSVFYPADIKFPRKGGCFYADKFKKVHHGKLPIFLKDLVEITRGEKNSQTPYEIADLFRKSEVFYVLENTALAIEATLCGCPVVFLQNEYLSEIISSKELGGDGYAWGDSPEQLSRAKKTVDKAYQNYLAATHKFSEDLDNFILDTQSRASKIDYTGRAYVKLYAEIVFQTNRNYITNVTPKTEPDMIAPSLLKFPWWVERYVAEFLSTLGFINSGILLFNRSASRFENKAHTRTLNWTRYFPISIQKYIVKKLRYFNLRADADNLDHLIKIRERLIKPD